MNPRGESTDRAPPARLLAWSFAFYLAFVTVVAWSFAGRELWSDEIVSLMLMGGHDPASIAAGEYTAEALAALYKAAPGSSLSEIWRHAAERDNHPPGYSLLFAAMIKLAGVLAPAEVRFLNIALSGLFVFPLLLFMRETGWRPGLGSAAIAVFSPFAIYAAREIRPYGIMMALTLLSAWLALRASRSERVPVSLLLALLAVNVIGCTQHKLFVLVVAGQLVFLGLEAVGRRQRRRLAAVAALALATGLLLATIPNLLTVGPTIGAFETAWLQAPQTASQFGMTALTYLAYYGSWWIAPPDDLMDRPYAYAFIAAFAGLLLWSLYLLVRELVKARVQGPAILFIVPLAGLLALFLVTGNDFSRAARYSLIWVPVAAAWVVTRLRPGRERRWFVVYAAISLLVSDTLVLAGVAHRNTDRTREFAKHVNTLAAPRLVWLLDETLNSRALLLALQSEMSRSGVVPPPFLAAPVSAGEAGVKGAAETLRPGDVVAGPARYRDVIAPFCIPESPVVVMNYLACRVP